MRSPRRYPTDLTDKQWAIIEALLPPPNTDGRWESHPRREIVNAILYVVRTGCSWRMLPRDFPPWQTVYWYFARWRDDGTIEAVHDALREEVRSRKKRKPTPTAGIIDSQALRGADTVGATTRGFDAGKRVNGRKRHVITDTLGLLLVVVVTAASSRSTPTSTSCPACKPARRGSSNNSSFPAFYRPSRAERRPGRSAGRRPPEPGRSVTTTTEAQVADLGLHRLRWWRG